MGTQFKKLMALYIHNINMWLYNVGTSKHVPFSEEMSLYICSDFSRSLFLLCNHRQNI
jgi:hypothetical protein